MIMQYFIFVFLDSVNDAVSTRIFGRSQESLKTHAFFPFTYFRTGRALSVVIRDDDSHNNRNIRNVTLELKIRESNAAQLVIKVAPDNEVFFNFLIYYIVFIVFSVAC